MGCSLWSASTAEVHEYREDQSGRSVDCCSFGRRVFSRAIWVGCCLSVRNEPAFSRDAIQCSGTTTLRRWCQQASSILLYYCWVLRTIYCGICDCDDRRWARKVINLRPWMNLFRTRFVCARSIPKVTPRFDSHSILIQCHSGTGSLEVGLNKPSREFSQKSVRSLLT